jgi:hypothetical protein
MKTWTKHHQMTQAQREDCETYRKKFAALKDCLDILPDCVYKSMALRKLEDCMGDVEDCILLFEPEGA